MTTTPVEVQALSRRECLELLGSVEMGRIAFTQLALPAILPINFTLVDGDIVVRTDGASALARSLRGSVVAFEADSIDPVTHAGWSVTCVGQARPVVEPDDIALLERVCPQPWVGGDRAFFARINPEVVSGRQLVPRREP